MKIKVLFTGGTIGCAPLNGYLSPGAKKAYALIDNCPFSGAAEFYTEEIYNILSENAEPDHLMLLASAVKKALKEDNDGIIITHGTDSLCYVAAAVGLMLGSCTKPVIFVSANKPLNDLSGNGYINFNTAVRAIIEHIGYGVLVSYKNSDTPPLLHRAARVIPQNAYTDDVFSARGTYMYALTDIGFTKNSSYREKDDETEPFTPCGRAGIITVSPSPLTAMPSLDKDTDAVLLLGYHSGTLPTGVPEFIRFCKNAAEAGIPLYLCGAYGGIRYESTASFDRLGIRVLPEASPCAMLAKLWLTHGSDDKRLYMSVGGDIIP